MKYITVGLLLLVCFFGGMTYGTLETNQALGKQEIKTEQETETMEMEPFTAEELETRDETAIDEDMPVIHQTASLFEQIILSVYSFFIGLMYSAADVFF